MVVMSQQATELSELIAALPADLSLIGCTVVRYGYREVRVVGDDVTDGPYATGDQLDLLQFRLAAAAGSQVGNHECYGITNSAGQTLYLWFRDWRVAVGTAVRPY
jgi:hypothetical protein